ncbi:MAG: class I SAM-dependent methyltransferase [Pseudomonadota bacterium]
MIARIFRKIQRLISGSPKAAVFSNSSQYWDDRYKVGGNSGAGSYGRLAQFKAEVLNDFVVKQEIRSVVEFGCGDGAQLDLANYPEYTGFDVSPKAVEICRARFPTRPTFQFFGTDTILEKEGSFDLAISLDVIYHLIEDAVFDGYMRRLFASSRKFVIIYSNNVEKTFDVQHVRGRRFTQWCDEHAKDWTLLQVIENRYPYDPAQPNETSHSDFYVYKKVAG